MLLVDGYNVIWASKRLARLARLRSLDHARERLVNEVRLQGLRIRIHQTLMAPSTSRGEVERKHLKTRSLQQAHYGSQCRAACTTRLRACESRCCPVYSKD